jgi:hypothetical protein
MYFSHILLPPSSSFPLLPPVAPPERVPLFTIMSYYYTFLGLDSAREQKHAIFVFLSLVYLTEHDDLQFHPFSCK